MSGGGKEAVLADEDVIVISEFRRLGERVQNLERKTLERA